MPSEELIAHVQPLLRGQPQSEGCAPPPWLLPSSTRMGAVELAVADLQRSIDSLDRLLRAGDRPVRGHERGEAQAWANLRSVRRAPTAPIAAVSFLAGWGVVAATGSRAAGGAVLAAGGLWCIAVWRRRHGNRTAAALGAAGLIGFVLSHVLALAIGPWPAVILVAGATGALAWICADSRGKTLPAAPRAATR